MKRFSLAVLVMLFSTMASAQYLTPAVNSNLFPAMPSTGMFPIASGASAADWKALSNDCTLTSTGAITCTKTNGTAFGPIATLGIGTNLTSGGGNLNATTSVSPIRRQSILSSSVDSTGFPNFAVIGTGLNVNLTATATPLDLSFAAGFSSTGATDFIGQELTDAASFWASLPANQYSFLSIDRNSGTGVLTATQTLVRPQRGPAFYAPRQALLHLENNATDDWGNAWTPVGAGVTFTNGCAKFGSFGANITGGVSYIQTVAIFNPGQSNWFKSVWTKLTSNASQSIFSTGNLYGVYIATNASGKLTLFLSSGGVAWDISNGTAGATTVTTGAFHNIELDFNGSSYVVYLDGTAEITVSSSVVVWPDGVAMGIGTQVGTGTGATNNSCFDEFEFGNYARHVANFTPAVAASTISGDWFDSNKMVMNTATAAGPTWTTVQRIYVAEAATGASTVSAVYDYSAAPQFSGADFALNASGKLRIGNHVIYAEGTPQFITGSTPGTACNTVPACTIGSPVTWVLTPAQVPPDAKWFDVQINVFHAAIGGTNPGNSDCTLQSRIPIGTVQGYIALGAVYNNFTGFGTITNTSAFIETAGTVARFPVLNGVAAFETTIGGNTCNTGGTNNQARIVTGILLGYDMP